MNQSADQLVRPDRRILNIALPAILANSAAPLIGLVDTWTLANFANTAELAAIGAGTTVFSFILWAFGFLRMGTTGLVAQAQGQRNTTEIARLTVQALVIGLFLGITIILLSYPLLGLGRSLLNLPSGVASAFDGYFLIRILGSPLTLATYGILGVLLGQERARAVMSLQMLLNVANGVLNLVFVIGFTMGAAGVALGTIIAELLTFGAGVFLLIRPQGMSPLKAAFFDKATWAITAMMRLIKVNGLLFVRTILLLVVFFTVTKEAAKLGEAALAASHVINTFLLLISLGLDGFAYAAEALVGAAYGDKDRQAFHRWSIRCGAWSVATSLLYVAIFWFMGPAIINMLIPTDGEAVATLLNKALWLIAIMPLIGVWSYIFDGIFVGATASAGMAITMALSAAGFYLMIGPFSNGEITGIWTALVLFLGLRGLFQALYYPFIARSIR